MEFVTAMALLAFAWAATLSGVIVGGHLVFKASGNTGSLFNRTQGGAYNINDGTELTEPNFDEQTPSELQRQMERFKKSFDPGESIFGAADGVKQHSKHGAARPFEAPVPPKPGETDDASKGEDQTGKA